MKALVGAFNQEKALVGAFSVIVQPVVEPMDRFTALIRNIADMATFCKRKSFFVFPAQKRDLQSAHKQCQAMGGEIAVPEGEEENSEIMDLVRTHSTCLENPNSIAWIGIEKKSEYPQWIYVNPTDIAMDAVR